MKILSNGSTVRHRKGATHRQPSPELGYRIFILSLFTPSKMGIDASRGRSQKRRSAGLGQPTLIALAATILAKRKAYYEALEAANKDNEITAWLSWFAVTAIEDSGQPSRALNFSSTRQGCSPFARQTQ